MPNDKHVKPRILPGFLELLPNDQKIFNSMKDLIGKTYAKYGYQHIETPTIELADIILAKGGGETTKQVYRFSKGKNDLLLPYDLTVPLARYTAQYLNEIKIPFKRYQIQKVWRAEKPQAGRFREFYQCDIDVIGSFNLMYDAEIPSIIYDIFNSFDFGDFIIKINHRDILNGFFEWIGLPENTEISSILRIVDKIDKIGEVEVKISLENLGFSKESISSILTFINISGTNNEILKSLESLKIDNQRFINGLKDLKNIIANMLDMEMKEKYFKIDLKIARGLDYYTGIIYETFIVGHESVGSICSGGRYDNLTKYYTDRTDLPGVGISIGLTRLYYQLKKLNLIKSTFKDDNSIIILNSDNKHLKFRLQIAKRLRENNIKVDVYYETIKLKKQFKYADKLNFSYVITINEETFKEKKILLKNMSNGEQHVLSELDLINFFK